MTKNHPNFHARPGDKGGSLPGRNRETRSATYLGMTRSTCPHCLALVNARIESENNRVYFQKYCPDHGFSRALVSEDARHYITCRQYAHPGSIPHRFATEVKKGCPQDCGLCPDHQQHTCHPIIEISHACDLDCPTCIVPKEMPAPMSPDELSGIIETLLEAEGYLENVTFSGGEPTMHPEFWKMVEAAQQPGIHRVSVTTNGLRIAADEDFCKQLKEQNIYVLLQWDGCDDDAYLQLRGRELSDIKKKALENLEKYGIAVQLIFTAALGLNDNRLGDAVRLLLEKENILSLAIQPLTFPAHKSMESFSPLERLTVPGVIAALEEQSGGLLKKQDFIPLPCPNPECVSLTYLLRLDDGSYVPFPRFVEMEKYLGMLSQSATIAPNRETEEALQGIINDLWSTAGEVPDCDCITRALKRALLEMFDGSKGERRNMMRAAERQAKSIFIHHYMDRYNFDLARVIKCCHHYPLADGRVMPICAHNLFHR